ncbi:PREDICTED: solute carrier family 2, facilitated glucose transporter member 8-like [Acropora digitifera]|uniref:solute carrier family 2, facilitated glucose transporter member 8-like n=1 Tax=Acropora digitifera TaxID=70779 RepID=UPI00077A384B|nr:PREDICTED: solute carrier family 2, facilitated glucose transporter member 8-like [Acropora digitifera]
MAKAWKAIIATFIAALGPFSLGYQLPYTSEALLDLQSDVVDSSIHLSDAQGTWFSVRCFFIISSIYSILIWRIQLKATFISSGSLLDQGFVKHSLCNNVQNKVIPVYYSGHDGAKLMEWVNLSRGNPDALSLVWFDNTLISLFCEVYIAEIVPARLRGMLGSVHQLAVTLGILSSYIMGALVHWQRLALFGAIPPALQVVFMFSMPETPRWSLEKNRRNEALIALQWLRGPDADNEKECDTIVDSFDHNENLKWRDFLSPVILKPLVISIGLLVLQQFCGVNAVIFNAASIFKDAGFNKATLVSISVGLIQFVGTALACLLMDRAGRRILLWTMALGMCVTLAGLGFYFEVYIPAKTDSTPASDTVSLLGSIHRSSEASKISWLSILCLVLFNLAYAVAWGPIPWLVMSEIFPLKARGPASSLATLFSSLFAFVTIKTYNSLVSGLTIQGTFWFYSGFSLLGFVFVFFVVPETKGKTLEEIEAMFHTGKHAYLRIE